MARLEADAKAGFYPTPPVEMEHIIKRISSNVDDVTLLDPCAGEGLALKQLRDHLQEQDVNSVTYGIEVEETRARSEEHTSELQSRGHLVCRLLLEKKKKK